MARALWRARTTVAVTITATAIAGLGAVATQASATSEGEVPLDQVQVDEAVLDDVQLDEVRNATSDTHVLRSRPHASFGGSGVLVVRGRGGQALVSIPTPTADEGLQPISAALCVTPNRTARTRVVVHPTSSEWSERSTWVTRPPTETSLLGTSADRPVAGRRMCIAVPVSALEPGGTEFRLRSTRQRRRAHLWSSEAGAGRAPALKVTFATDAAARPKPSAPPTPSTSPTSSPTTSPTTSPTSEPTTTPTTSPTTSPTTTPTQTPTGDTGKVLWDGAFEVGGVPNGANGPSCGTGTADGPDNGSDQYSSVEEMGNTSCTNVVEMSRSVTRTSDSQRSLKVVIDKGQQREQPQSKYSWVPDGKGTVDQWYGFSMYYASDWNLGGGILKEISGSYWHNPIAFRMVGDNGSLNFSGDMDLNNANGQPYTKFSEPHMVLRRNTVKNQQGFYTDGKGLDKIDLGPIVTGKWMDFVCHIRWSTTSTNALRECWRDGVYMGGSRTVNAVAGNRHYLRVGQYQETNIGHTRTTYFDNVRIGTSYAAVDPARAR